MVVGNCEGVGSVGGEVSGKVLVLNIETEVRFSVHKHNFSDT